ncbi:SMU1112c/YaeR family gloxylase I-like metalloprotein [Aquabacterium sp. OR-4]|uniref:SMU1112c/YaeR family gloxylase I-like metalloprotein n=1 Tax=Aquabacterium sp. OR-4 TaxID=2978127 RepID=UPI0028C57331|nr:VOC family protein [Aquabacterium sp. OR-4]MDT7835355.1 VOC family protein [Aquabacterium sp. OR-4]
MLQLCRIHHVAIICSDIERSKAFYVNLLGLRVVAEQHRVERQSHKLDLAMPDGSQIELFSFPSPPPRPSRPEAQGLRHLAFAVDDVAHAKAWLESKGVAVEPVRVDEYTSRRFTFFADPDGLPLELCESHVGSTTSTRSSDWSSTPPAPWPDTAGGRLMWRNCDTLNW